STNTCGLVPGLINQHLWACPRPDPYTPSMDARRIARIRMRTQRLWGRGFDTIEDTVRFLGAIQAQEFQYAKWSIAQRTRGVLDADVQRAFEEGSILRTHVLRPTWHFV